MWRVDNAQSNSRMNAQPLSELTALSYNQRSSLRKGNILTVPDLLILSSQDIAKRCRISHSEAQEIVNTVFDELEPPPLIHLDTPDIPQDDLITTGDHTLDKALGGGVRTRKLWEVTGESAAGKTQLAMQLALCVQLPSRLGGVSGAACFLSTSWTLPTNRLVEMISNHPALSSAVCGLADIHTIKTPTIPLLLHVLSETLPAFLDSRKSQPETKPVKLLVIDAITELFHSDEAVSTTTLAQRSRHLTEIATLLHMLAHKHGLAVVVLNEVSDVINRDPPPDAKAHEVSYRDQAHLFNRADSIPGESSKEAALGLVWANQVNARIMLTRTNRMRVVDDTEYRPHKRRKTTETAHTAPSGDVEPVRIRRLSVVFNCLAPPVSLDYIITASGFVVLETDETFPTMDTPTPRVSSNLPTLAPLEDICPLDIPLAFNSSAGPSSDPSLPSSATFAPEAATSPGGAEHDLSSEMLDAENGPQADDDDDWEKYWKDGDIGSDFYSQVDLDALSSGN